MSSGMLAALIITSLSVIGIWMSSQRLPHPVDDDWVPDHDKAPPKDPTAAEARAFGGEVGGEVGGEAVQDRFVVTQAHGVDEDVIRDRSIEPIDSSDTLDAEPPKVKVVDPYLADEQTEPRKAQVVDPYLADDAGPAKAQAVDPYLADDAETPKARAVDPYLADDPPHVIETPQDPPEEVAQSRRPLAQEPPDEMPLSEPIPQWEEPEPPARTEPPPAQAKRRKQARVEPEEPAEAPSGDAAGDTAGYQYGGSDFFFIPKTHTGPIPGGGLPPRAAALPSRATPAADPYLADPEPEPATPAADPYLADAEPAPPAKPTPKAAKGGAKAAAAKVAAGTRQFIGVVRGHASTHSDGRERRYIMVKKKEADGFPWRESARVPVDLEANGKVYSAGVRSAPSQPTVYIAADLRGPAGEEVTLAAVLEEMGLEKKQHVAIEVQGTHLRLVGRADPPAKGRRR